jgi:hypothetical protein
LFGCRPACLASPGLAPGAGKQSAADVFVPENPAGTGANFFYKHCYSNADANRFTNLLIIFKYRLSLPFSGC